MLPRDAEDLAEVHMDKHGLLDKGWKLKWSTMSKRTHGICRHQEKTITLNFHWVKLNEPEEVLDTILHEIAHALTPGAKHGPIWKAKARELGARPETYDMVSKSIEARWNLYCGGCRQVLRTTHRRTKIHNRYCLTCGKESLGKLKYVAR